jgi:predicted TIM-barrel fold metal-dependent hydrolase
MQVQEHPSFIGFGTVHPYMADPLGEISRFMALGLKGIKLHSDFQEFPIDDPQAFPIYRKAEREGIPILFHCGDSRFGFAYSSPLRLISTLGFFPGLKAIAAHFGGYSEWEHVTGYPKLPNLYFDTCSSLFLLPREKCLELIGLYGASQFFFGSDFPMWDHQEELERFRALGLSKADEALVLGGNFARFMGQET